MEAAEALRQARRALALKQATEALEMAYNPGQDRAADGKWTDGFPGGGAKHSRLKTSGERHAALAPHKERLRKAAEAHEANPTDETEAEFEKAHAKLRVERRKLARTDLDKDGKGFEGDKQNTRSRFDAEKREQKLAKYKEERAEAIDEYNSALEDGDEDEVANAEQRVADAEEALKQKRRDVGRSEKQVYERERAPLDAETRKEELDYRKREYHAAKSEHEKNPTPESAAKLEQATKDLKQKRANLGSSQREEFGRQVGKHKQALELEPGSEERNRLDDAIYSRGAEKNWHEGATEAERIHRRNTSEDQVERGVAHLKERLVEEDPDRWEGEEDDVFKERYLKDQDDALSERLKESLGAGPGKQRATDIIDGATKKSVSRAEKMLAAAQKRGDTDAAEYWTRVAANGRDALATGMSVWSENDGAFEMAVGVPPPKASSRSSQERQTGTQPQTEKTSPTSYVLPLMLVEALRGASVDRQR